MRYAIQTKRYASDIHKCNEVTRLHEHSHLQQQTEILFKVITSVTKGSLCNNYDQFVQSRDEERASFAPPNGESSSTLTSTSFNIWQNRPCDRVDEQVWKCVMSSNCSSRFWRCGFCVGKFFVAILYRI